MDECDVVIIGAGAAGMMCAIEAALRGRRVVVVDHNRTVGEKIRISGGGRCNFTNLHCAPDAFLSQNPKFAVSALSRFTQWDMIARLDQAEIAWHEKTLGQLFCDGSARQIISMLSDGMARNGVKVVLNSTVTDIKKEGASFSLDLSGRKLRAKSLVIASGGKSIPKIGASDFGIRVARKFGLAIEPTRAGLVALTFSPADLEDLKPLAGLSVDASVTCGSACFHEGLLFTHRGLSGPSILQISNYWHPSGAISIDLMAGRDAVAFLREAKAKHGAKMPATVFAHVMPKRLAQLVCRPVPTGVALADLTASCLAALAQRSSNLQLTPSGTEGYRTAEVMLGGVSTRDLDSRTMAAKSVEGLYFIGEVVDVTGWLGGYNFQWAWSSGWAAGQVA